MPHVVENHECTEAPYIGGCTVYGCEVQAVEDAWVCWEGSSGGLRNADEQSKTGKLLCTKTLSPTADSSSQLSPSFVHSVIAPARAWSRNNPTLECPRMFLACAPDTWSSLYG